MGNDPVNLKDPTGGKTYIEYPDAKAYYKANPNGKLDGSDGHWLKADRLNNSSVWKTANMVNLRAERFNDYRTISERRDFYKWIAVSISDRGFDNMWPGAAYVVAKNISKFDDPLVKSIFDDDVIKFANDGNKAIFDDVFPNLKALYFGKPMKGREANGWDFKTLWHEQYEVVDPIYRAQSKETIKLLSRMAHGKDMFWSQNPKLLFKGDLTNPQDRFIYGMGPVVDDWKLRRDYIKLGWE